MPRAKRLCIAFILAAVCASVFFSRVYLRFDSIRTKIVTTPLEARQGAVVIDLRGSPRLDGAPAALVLRMRNDRQSSAIISSSIGGRELARTTLRPRSSARVDVALDPEDLAGGILRLTADRDDWFVESAELSNQFGFARGLLNLVIVPPEMTAYAAPSALLSVVVFVLLLALGVLGLRFDHPSSLRPWHYGLIIVSVLILGAVLAAEFVTRYRVLLALPTFLLCMVIVYAAPLSRLCRTLRWRTTDIAGTQGVDAATVGVVAFVFYSSMMLNLLAGHHGDYSGFIHLSQSRLDRTPVLAERPDLKRSLRAEESEGYDGQFMYLMSFDPFLSAYKRTPAVYRDIVDAPPYRYGRIGFSLLTKLLSLNRAELFPQTMMWMILASHLIGASCLAGIAAHYGVTPFYALTYLLIPGYLSSITFALPESLAGAALLGGVLLDLKGRYRLAALSFAGSLLIRETGLILVGALAAWAWIVEKNRRHGATLAASILPIAMWRAFVAWRLFADWGWAALFYDPGDVTWPFKGLAALWTAVTRGNYPEEVAAAGLVFPILLTLAGVLALILFFHEPQALGAALIAYCGLAVSLTYDKIWSHVASGERGTYEVFLLLAISSVSLAWRRSWLTLVVGAFWLMVLIYDFTISPEDFSFRAGFIVIR